MNAPGDFPFSVPARIACSVSVAWCLCFVVGLPSLSRRFLVSCKPVVDERGLDRGAAAEVEDRLRRWTESGTPPNHMHEIPELNAWTDFRRNAVRWAPALCRIARSRMHPQRLTAIGALRFFGSEHAWEHRCHARDGTPCVLGCEPCRDDCERVLISLVREGGEVRDSALCALSAYRTRSAAACLVAEADEENAPDIQAYLEWQRSGSVNMIHTCAFESVGSPGMLLTWPGEERAVLRSIKRWWRGVEDGTEGVIPSNESVLREWDIFVPR